MPSNLTSETKAQLTDFLADVDTSGLDGVESIKEDLEELQAVLAAPIESTKGTEELSAEEKSLLYEEK